MILENPSQAVFHTRGFSTVLLTRFFRHCRICKLVTFLKTIIYKNILASSRDGILSDGLTPTQTFFSKTHMTTLKERRHVKDVTSSGRYSGYPASITRFSSIMARSLPETASSRTPQKGIC